MTRSRKWLVEISIDEHDRNTHAQARLRINDASTITGHGVAWLNPIDRDVPEIGDELAAARAVLDLGNALLHATADDIEMVTRQPAHLEPAGSSR